MISGLIAFFLGVLYLGIHSYLLYMVWFEGDGIAIKLVVTALSLPFAWAALKGIWMVANKAFGRDIKDPPDPWRDVA